MLAYTARRLLAVIPVMLVVATIVFILMRLGPSDPAAVMAGEFATQQQLDAIRVSYGFDQPLYTQYFLWLGELLRGNFGVSIFTQVPVTTLISQRLESTFSLTGFAMCFALAISLPLGTLAAARAGSTVDRVVMIFAVSAYSFPVFLIAYIMVLLFALQLGWFPVQGYKPLSSGVGMWFWHLVLPGVSLGMGFAALLARISRAAVIETLQSDYVRTARSKGLSFSRVVVKHALRNAAVPITTVVGLGVAGLISGVVITETVFAIPGIGRLTVDGILNRDYPVVQGCVLFFSFAYVLINLLIDLAYAALDPRIRY